MSAPAVAIAADANRHQTLIGHHRTGGLYEITIHLSLPEGREVNIGRTPQNDERYADIDYALNDAFKRASAVAG